jgi:hypothetical protein
LTRIRHGFFTKSLRSKKLFCVVEKTSLQWSATKVFHQLDLYKQSVNLGTGAFV